MEGIQEEAPDEQKRGRLRASSSEFREERWLGMPVREQ